MPKPAAEYAGIPLPEVEVFSNRLLSVDTTEKVLNELDKIPCIRQITMTGESLPKTINSGPNKGLENNHTERKVIKVGNHEVEIRYLVGAFYIELNVENEEQLDEAMATIKAACEKHMAHGFTVGMGRFMKYKESMTDYRE